MTTGRCHVFLALLMAGLLNSSLVSVGYAQVTTNITSSGLGTAVNGSTSTPCVGGTCNITGGMQRGSNLFHSFGLQMYGGYRDLATRQLAVPRSRQLASKIFSVESPGAKSPTYLGQFRRQTSVRQICSL